MVIIVLSDGETWSTLDGVSLCVITDAQYSQLSNDEIAAHDLQPIAEIGLKDYASN